MIVFTLWVIGVLSIVFAVLVLMASSRLIDSLFFAGFSIGMGLWSAMIGLFLATTDPKVAEISVTLYYASALFLIYNLILFSLRYVYRDKLAARSYIYAGAAAALPIVVVLVFAVASGAMFEEIVLSPRHDVILNSAWYTLYVMCFVIYGLGVIYLLYKRLKLRRSNVSRKESKAIFWTISLCLSFAAVPNLLLPWLGDYRFIMLGPLLILPVLIVFFYAIIRYSLFDLRLALVRSIAYIATLTILGCIYVLLSVGISSWLFNQPINAGMAASYVVLSILPVFLFQPLRKFFDKYTDQLFYRENYDEETFLSRFTRLLVTGRDLRALLERAAYEISDTLKADQVSFFLFRRDNRYMTAGTKGYKRMPVSDGRGLESMIDLRQQITIADQLDSEDPARRLLISHKVALVLPLKRGSDLLGYLMLGEHRGRPYTTRDLRVLETISDELTIAIENAIAVQEVKDLNTTLQQRIDEATEELRRSNAELQRLDQAKDEFVSMASHQLRTPLTSVKGYISMVLDGDVGKITDSQRKLLGEAFTSSDRMVHLINDFLNVSRLQTGRFMLDRQLTDLAKLIKQEVDSLESTAQARELEIKYVAPASGKIPQLYIDEGKLRQVVMNFIDNAIYYSPSKSRIYVKLTTEDNNVIMTVEDTGIGVPKSEQERLFKKFFRASNARRQRPDGTGVGLFLAKRVVHEHGGRIIFESKEGEGSTFGFSLPIKRLSLAPRDQSD